MLANLKSFSSFSVNNINKAKEFYGKTLGLNVSEVSGMTGLLNIQTSGNEVMIYEKPDHEPAAFTVLNFRIKNIENKVDELTKAGIQFEQYDQPEIKTNTKGISSGGGVKIAWFKDPSGNILSIVEEQ
ncbi:MAG: VOC family protein [Ignavibacteriales bacterium]|nr:MAG: VOC family protein [Ignavibacteriales bacterium]